MTTKRSKALKFVPKYGRGAGAGTIGAMMSTRATMARRPKGAEAVETLANTPKQEECKLNLCCTGFKVKEGESEKELVQRLNTELLQSQMKLHAKVIIAMRQWPAIARASASMVGTHPNTVLLKFMPNEDR
ncbi:unnamed protein product [Sphagnum balticum]